MPIRVRWLVPALALLLTPHADADSAEEDDLTGLLAKVAEAYGGAEELATMSGFRARGKILSVMEGLSGTIKLTVSYDRRMRVEIRYPHRNEVRVLSGHLAWNGGRSAQTPSTAAMAASIQFQYHRLAAPFELVTAATEDLETVGSSEEGWTIVRRVWSRQLRTDYEIDPETGMIHRIRGEVGPTDDPVAFVTESSDLRAVEGFVFPFRTTMYVGEDVAAETILDRVNVVEEFSEESFVPAGSGSDL